MPKYTQKERSDLAKKAVDLLKAGHDIGDVSRLLNVSSRSVQRWRRDQEGSQIVALAQAMDEVDSATKATLSPYNLPSDEDVRNKIQCLTSLALNTIEGILRCPDSRSADKLRACGLILDASGHNDPAASVVSRAIDLLLRQGYVITDPSLPLPAKDQGMGLTDEMAQLIRQKILFGDRTPETPELEDALEVS